MLLLLPSSLSLLRFSASATAARLELVAENYMARAPPRSLQIVKQDGNLSSSPLQ